jgi:hypothetical protein
MAADTVQNPQFIEAEQYSQFILRNLEDGLLPGSFWRDVSDFGMGTTLNIKSIGEATVQEVEENTPLVYNPIETGNVTLSITDYIGDAWYITDVLRQDGNQIEALSAARAQEATRAIQERFETRFFQECNSAQTAGNANTINGFAHRAVAGGTAAAILTVQDFIDMKLAFDKAEVPYGGRIAIIDPVAASTLEGLYQGTARVDSNPTLQGILEGGFARDHEFVMNIHGWNIITSNRLADIPAGTDVDGSVTITNAGKANVFMSVMDDQTKPMMTAWRQQPKVESERNKDRQRDEFLTTARWGVGPQRVDTLGILVTDATTA